MNLYYFSNWRLPAPGELVYDRNMGTLYCGIAAWPVLIGHVYWHEKPAFQLSEDVYSYWVAFAVEEGCFAYRIGSKEGTAAFGDIVLCPLGVPFGRNVIEPVSFHFLMLRWTDREGRELPGEAAAQAAQAGVLSLSDRERLSSTYTYLREWAESGEDASLAMRSHYVKDLWALQAIRPGSPGEHDPLMARAARTLRQEASAAGSARAFKLGRLASELGITQVQFTRRFKKATGMSPIDYWISQRLQHVQQLLRSTDLTLRQIAEQCGFENEFYLSRLFTKKKRLTPSHYRRLHRM